MLNDTVRHGFNYLRRKSSPAVLPATSRAKIISNLRELAKSVAPNYYLCHRNRDR